jgi:hypothetical protein
MRRAIADDGPYSFVKLSHHGSDNAFSEAILQELGDTALYGICAGEHSEKHPNAAVLKALNTHRNDIPWARTDRNGSSPKRPPHPPEPPTAPRRARSRKRRRRTCRRCARSICARSFWATRPAAATERSAGGRCRW